MKTTDFCAFVEELGVQPERVRVGAGHWRDMLLEMLEMQRYRPTPPPSAITELQIWTGLRFAPDFTLAPAAFEFDFPRSNP